MITLICTQHYDPHAESVAESIQRRGENALLLKRYNQKNYLDFKFNHSKVKAWLEVDSQKYSLERDISGILWRIKPSISSEMPGKEPSVEEKFRKYEWLNSIYSLEEFVTGKSINRLEDTLKFSRKIIQLKLAIECGLLVPETIISNSANNLLDCLKSEDLIDKTLSAFVTHKQIISTNKISQFDISENENLIFSPPGIFQNLIGRDHELRIKIFGERIFISKVGAQKYVKRKQTGNMIKKVYV